MSGLLKEYNVSDSNGRYLAGAKSDFVKRLARTIAVENMGGIIIASIPTEEDGGDDSKFYSDSFRAHVNGTLMELIKNQEEEVIKGIPDVAGVLNGKATLESDNIGISLAKIARKYAAYESDLREKDILTMARLGNINGQDRISFEKFVDKSFEELEVQNSDVAEGLKEELTVFKDFEVDTVVDEIKEMVQSSINDCTTKAAVLNIAQTKIEDAVRKAEEEAAANKSQFDDGTSSTPEQETQGALESLIPISPSKFSKLGFVGGESVVNDASIKLLKVCDKSGMESFNQRLATLTTALSVDNNASENAKFDLYKGTLLKAKDKAMEHVNLMRKAGIGPFGIIDSNPLTVKIAVEAYKHAMDDRSSVEIGKDLIAKEIEGNDAVTGVEAAVRIGFIRSTIGHIVDIDQRSKAIRALESLETRVFGGSDILFKDNREQLSATIAVFEKGLYAGINKAEFKHQAMKMLNYDPDETKTVDVPSSITTLELTEQVETDLGRRLTTAEVNMLERFKKNEDVTASCESIYETIAIKTGAKQLAQGNIDKQATKDFARVNTTILCGLEKLNLILPKDKSLIVNSDVF